MLQNSLIELKLYIGTKNMSWEKRMRADLLGSIQVP